MDKKEIKGSWRLPKLIRIVQPAQNNQPLQKGPKTGKKWAKRPAMPLKAANIA
jgi:hypothetical protein